MAITSDGFKGSITLVDNGNNQSTLQYDLVGADFAAALADMTAIVAALDPLTDAVVKTWTVGEKYSEKALTLPIGGVQVENVALVSVRITGHDDKYGQFRIPAPVAGLFSASSGDLANVVDPNDADLSTYGAIFGAGGHATISDGETIQGVSGQTTKGKRIHRGSRKG